MNREEAWELEKETLVKMANQNTFLAIPEAFRRGWDMAMAEIERKIKIRDG